MSPAYHSNPALIRDLLKWVGLIVATLIITVPFLGMLQPFLVALTMAAIVAGISRGLFRWINGKLDGHTNLASAVTLILLLVVVIVPILVLATMAGQQAAGLARGAVTAVNALIADPAALDIPEWVPFQDRLDEIGPEIAAKLGDLITAFANFTFSALSTVTRGTAIFFLNAFVFIYAMFFFLKMDVSVIDQILKYTSLPVSLQTKLSDRIMSVSRATIKGTLLIGVVQGVLGGIGFWAAGLDSAVFWGVVMAVASVIPGVGAGFVLTIAVIYLFSIGEIVPAFGLGLWAALVVTTIDNILRPILVGRDAKLHDILILVSTLGGLAFFGAVGLVLGPVLAGLFVTIWTTLGEEIQNQGKAAETAAAAASDAAASDGEP